MAFCSNSAAQISDEALFCVRCGVEVRQNNAKAVSAN